MVCPILSHQKIFSFEPVLRARAEVCGPLNVAVDGGAGWGDTAKTILHSAAADSKVYAFEPFPGNHSFFAGCDERIKLVKAAIADHAGVATFNVPRIVQTDDNWAQKGLAGYSSVGHIDDATAVPLWRRTARMLRGRAPPATDPTAQRLEVQVVTIEATVTDRHVDFIKLDLQGAELKALQGAGALLNSTDMLWIEFSNQPGLFDFLSRRGFLLFDTNYLCAGASTAQLAAAGLEACEELTLSTSQPAVLARRLLEQSNYLTWFESAQRTAGLYQTDLLCIHPNFERQFLKMLAHL